MANVVFEVPNGCVSPVTTPFIDPDVCIPFKLPVTLPVKLPVKVDVTLVAVILPTLSIDRPNASFPVVNTCDKF